MTKRGIIGSLIAEALVGGRSDVMNKIAAETASCKECGKAVPSGSELCKECAEKAAKDEAQKGGFSGGGSDDTSPDTDSNQERTGSGLTDPNRVMKLASALDYIQANPHLVDWNEVAKLATSEMGGAVSPGSGIQMPTDDKKQPEQMPYDFGESSAHTIPTDPKVGPTQLRADPQDGKGPKPEPTSGVSGSGAGSKTASAIDRIKQAMSDIDRPTPEQPLQVSSGPAPAGLQRSAEVAKQEQLISSNEAAADATARQAREVPKRQTSEDLFEPMLSRSNDKTLDQVLGKDMVDQAGAKVASAGGSLLSKIASARCTCGNEGKCGSCRIKQAAERRMARAGGSLFEAVHNPGTQEVR